MASGFKVENFLISPFNLVFNSTIEKLYTKQKCDFHRNCGPNEVCPEGYCECEINHKLNQNNDCIEYKCIEDSECREYDSYSHCVKNQCKCNNKSFLDYQTGRCVPIHKCHNENECHDNQTCFSEICRCIQSNRWDLNSKRCMYFKCNQDIDCFMNTNNTCSCSVSGECICHNKIDVSNDNNKSFSVSFNRMSLGLFIFTIITTINI